jgi:AraC-like DNA-binding protein
MPGCRVRPPQSLAGLIECLWYWQGAPGPHLQERLLPTGEASLILNLREDTIAMYEDDGQTSRYSNAVFAGPRSSCFTIDCNQQERVAGVQFRPGGVFPFIRMPVSEIEDASFAVEDVWGAEAASIVRERVLAASTPLATLQVLGRCMEERLRVSVERKNRPHEAVLYMAGALNDCAKPARVQRVTERIGMSQRRVTQLFHEQVGVSPKTFHRVRRFQYALRQLRGRHEVDWADLAVACGYYDQAHLANDFRLLAGMTPGAYLAAATEHLNHVPLRD